MNGRERGFTLIELMIVLVVVAILSTIAYSSYQSQVEKTRIGQLHEALMTAGVLAERNVVANNEYPATLSPSYPDLFTYDYKLSTDKTRFVLSGVEKTSRFRLWSGINSAGTRCTCRQCSAPNIPDADSSAPAATDFAATTKSCPAGTEAF